ncbi:MAG: methionine--tRNA ligase subunit beta, partial [Streptococcus sp.]|nr:methionine--tRNA ligase subunit beta [Streptococcus sp.]
TFTPEDYVGRINYELANDLGNLLNRTVAMINKYFGGEVPAYVENVTEFDADLAALVAEKITEYHKQMNAVDYPRALDAVWSIISRTNKYIDETAPWVLAKDEAKRDELAAVMAHLAASLRVVAHLIQPFMMTTSNAIMEQLGLGANFDLENLALSGFPEGVKVVAKGTPIFPRLDMEAEIEYIKANMGAGAVVAEEKEWDPTQVELKNEKKAIKFDDFDKVEIRVAEVKEVSKVEGSEKLLKFRLDAGDGEDRQILSGIAKFYPNEQELVGKKLQIVANLKPRKMMGLVSQGMILSAEHDGNLTVLTVDPSVPNGSQIG